MRLHLGCWHRYIPGFTHVDLCDMPHIDYRSSIDNLPFIEDGAAELVYASHCFEYFDKKQAPDVLAEWRRVLSPGGTLRLAVPDFRALSELYLQTGRISVVLGPIYGLMEISTPEGPKMLAHKTCYDFESLSELLVAAGFGDVRRYDWRQTIHRDYDDHSQAYYPHMDKEHGKLVSLNVEATKV